MIKRSKEKKMYTISFSSITLYFFFYFLLIPPQNFPSTAAISSDIINQTCRKCAEKSPVVSYGLCTSSLQVVPVSHVANLQGLALIAMELALKNATSTVEIIQQLLLTSERVDPFYSMCLEDCLQLYSGGIATLVDAVGAFLGERYEDANVWVSSMMEATETCEGGFMEKEGEVELLSPLRDENYSLFQLCDIALCIGHLLISLDSK